MNSRKTVIIISGFVFAISLIVAATVTWLVSSHYNRLSFDLLNAVCCEVVEQEPGTQKTLSAALKEYTDGNPDGQQVEDVLSTFGYRPSDFSDLQLKQIASISIIGLLIGILLFFFTFLLRNKMENQRVRNLAEYLEQVNSGKALILSTSGEDDFSKLEDEIYKTVTYLYQIKDRAVLRFQLLQHALILLLGTVQNLKPFASSLYLLFYATHLLLIQIVMCLVEIGFVSLPALDFILLRVDFLSQLAPPAQLRYRQFLALFL